MCEGSPHAGSGSGACQSIAVSLVIPVYNEERNLPLLADEIRRAMQTVGQPYEVLFVDDGSSDGSLAVLTELAAHDPAVRVIRQARNSGQSAALDAGFRHARGGVVVTLDADLQNDPADIPLLLAPLADYDVVCGVRAQRRDTWGRRFSSGFANAVRNRLTRESIADIGCTLKAYRADYLRRVPVWNGMHRFLPTLLRMEGARVTEVNVSHRPRRYGVPKYNIRNRIWRASADLLGVRWLQARWIDRRLAEEVHLPAPPAAAMLAGAVRDPLAETDAPPPAPLATPASG